MQLCFVLARHIQIWAITAMAKPGILRSEIESLHAQLKERTATLADVASRHAAADLAAEVSAGARQHMHELERLVHELKSTIEDAASDTEASIAAHPLATLLSALLVGYAIGRMSRSGT